jgi:hypothetical protein
MAILKYENGKPKITQAYNTYNAIGVTECLFDFKYFTSMYSMKIYEILDRVFSNIGLAMVHENGILGDTCFNYVYPVDIIPRYSYGCGVYVKRDTYLRVIDDGQNPPYNAQVMLFYIGDSYHGEYSPSLPRFLSINSRNKFLDNETEVLRKNAVFHLSNSLYSNSQLDVLEYRFDDTPLKELAKILNNISVSAVKGQLNTIKKKSRNYFDQYITVEEVIRFLHEIRVF